MKKIVAIIFLINCFSAFAQLPQTQIFLADIEIKNNLVKVAKAENINNNKTYNNQPSFTNDEKSILFSSEVESNNKTHICQYDIKTKKTKRVSITNTSEYSPMPMADGKSFSVVLVEEDSTQRVWIFDVNTGINKYCLSQQTDSVGYYCWFGKDTILYYKLSTPHSLRALNIKTGEDVWLCNSPARSFKKINATSFFYVIHEEKQNLIYTYDIRLKKATLFATDTNPNNQDYVWQPTLGLLKSDQSKLYRYSTDTKVWAEVVDFTSLGVKKITRFAFNKSGKQLAFVSNLN